MATTFSLIAIIEFIAVGFCAFIVPVTVRGMFAACMTIGALLMTAATCVSLPTNEAVTSTMLGVFFAGLANIGAALAFGCLREAQKVSHKKN